VVSAFNLLRAYCPDLADEIIAGTRLVVLFQAEQPNSFATLSAHGAIFLNVNGAIDEVYFIEDIAHQAGHVTFNALTLAKERFLLINPDTPLGGPHGNDRESRTVYSAFHGMFTYVTIGQALAAVLERHVFDARQAHEALGRLGLVLRKFNHDLALLDRAEFWTPLGRRCWRQFESIFAGQQARYAPITQGFDYSNQPYVFDYHLFAELNPPVSSVPLRRTA
jgi:HEXXH motif-containing protein